MVGIQGNELTFRHHINSYFSDYGVWYEKTGREAPYGGIVDAHGNEVSEDDQLRAIARHGGLAIINHPGIPDHHAWWQRKPLDWYVERYRQHSADYLIGIEVTNNEPRSLSYDEGLWDQLLARFMPDRPIWGFGTDDTHDLKQARQSYTLFFLDALSEAAVRRAMTTGRFCFCHSTRAINYLDPAASLDVFPTIRQIVVDEPAGTIRIEASDCDTIRWISAPASLEPTEDYRTSDRPHRTIGDDAEVGPIGPGEHRTEGGSDSLRPPSCERWAGARWGELVPPYGEVGGAAGGRTLQSRKTLLRGPQADQRPGWLSRTMPAMGKPRGGPGGRCPGSTPLS